MSNLQLKPTEEATRRPGFPDKLSTKSCLLKSKFPFNEPPKPGLRVAEVGGWLYLFVSILTISLS